MEAGTTISWIIFDTDQKGWLLCVNMKFWVLFLWFLNRCLESNLQLTSDELAQCWFHQYVCKMCLFRCIWLWEGMISNTDFINHVLRVNLTSTSCPRWPTCLCWTWCLRSCWGWRLWSRRRCPSGPCSWSCRRPAPPPVSESAYCSEPPPWTRSGWLERKEHGEEKRGRERERGKQLERSYRRWLIQCVCTLCSVSLNLFILHNDLAFSILFLYSAPTDNTCELKPQLYMA